MAACALDIGALPASDGGIASVVVDEISHDNILKPGDIDGLATITITQLPETPLSPPAALQHESILPIRTKSSSSLHSEPTPSTNPPRCRLLELPAELREQIWSYAVSNWIRESTTPSSSSSSSSQSTLVRKPIRIDRFHLAPPPALTSSCSLIRSEALPLYYQLNTFSCRRPRRLAWPRSGLVRWLSFLGPTRRAWLTEVILLCGPHDDSSSNIEGLLAAAGVEVPAGVVRCVRQAALLHGRSADVGEEGGGRRFEQLGLMIDGSREINGRGSGSGTGRKRFRRGSRRERRDEA